MFCVSAALPLECGIRSYTDVPGWRQTLMYGFQPLNMIDLLAVIPFYIELAGAPGGGTTVLRVLRLIRVFRALKSRKLQGCVDMFMNVMRDALPALLTLVLLTLMMCVFFASCLFFAEGTDFSVDQQWLDAYPDSYGVYIRPEVSGYYLERSPFKSIYYAFWWFFATATTVGYGDDVPTTTLGRCVGVLTFYTGIILLAMPLTVIGGSFNKYYPIFRSNYCDDEEDIASNGSPSLDCLEDGDEGKTALPVAVAFKEGFSGKNSDGSQESKPPQMVPPGLVAPSDELKDGGGASPAVAWG